MHQIPLIRLAPQCPARIAGVRSKDNALINKLAALGILPGLPITIIQAYPSYLVQIDQTQLAMDRATAGCIEVVV